MDVVPRKLTGRHGSSYIQFWRKTHIVTSVVEFGRERDIAISSLDFKYRYFLFVSGRTDISER
jgi:hypothetical protein